MHTCTLVLAYFLANMNTHTHTHTHTHRHRYTAVGLLERFNDTLRLFEAAAPRWFTNLTDMYNEVTKAEAANHGHMRTHPVEHPKPSAETVDLLRSNNRQDVALYEHAKRRFEMQIAKISRA